MGDGSELETRLAELERDLRRVRGILLALLVASVALSGVALYYREPTTALVVVAAGALLLAPSAMVLMLWRLQRPVPEVVQARKFEVVDQTGKVLVEIGETLEGGGAVVTRGRSEGELPAATLNTAATASPSAPVADVKVELSYRGEGLYEAKVRTTRPDT